MFSYAELCRTVEGDAVKRLLTLLFMFSAPLWAQSKSQIALDAASQMAAWADMVSTEKAIHPQFRHEAGGVIVESPAMPEGDPLAVPFTDLPKPAYYALGTALTLSLAYLGNGMKKSRHGWERRVWWLPQAAQIAINAGFAIHNGVLLSRR